MSKGNGQRIYIKSWLTRLQRELLSFNSLASLDAVYKRKYISVRDKGGVLVYV